MIELLILIGFVAGGALLVYGWMRPTARHRWTEVPSSDVATVHRRVRRPR